MDVHQHAAHLAANHVAAAHHVIGVDLEARVVVEDGIVPLVPRGQQHLAVPRHLAQVEALGAGALGRLAQRAQLVNQWRNVDEGIVISFEHELGVPVAHGVLHDLARRGMAGREVGRRGRRAAPRLLSPHMLADAAQMQGYSVLWQDMFAVRIPPAHGSRRMS